MIIQLKKIIFFVFVMFLLPVSALASSDHYEACKTVLSNEPKDTFCKGYVKGYEAASNGNSGSGTGTVQNFVVYEQVWSGSSTGGHTAPDPFLITLPPNFRKLREAGSIDWATISDTNFIGENNTTIQVENSENQINSGVLKLKESIAIETYIKNNEDSKQAIKSLEPYIDILDADVTTQIFVRATETPNK